MQIIGKEIIKKLREIDNAILDLHHLIAVTLCDVAELDTLGLTLHDAECATTAAVEEQEHCHAGQDGDCIWEHCPQNRDGEPMKSGRHCPLAREYAEW